MKARTSSPPSSVDLYSLLYSCVQTRYRSHAAGVFCYVGTCVADLKLQKKCMSRHSSFVWPPNQAKYARSAPSAARRWSSGEDNQTKIQWNNDACSTIEASQSSDSFNHSPGIQNLKTEMRQHHQQHQCAGALHSHLTQFFVANDRQTRRRHSATKTEASPS